LELLEDRRLLSGGVLDPTFGTDGMVTTNVSPVPGYFSFALAVATYPSAGTVNDGKIVTAGAAIGSVRGRGNADDDLAVVRYNLDGSLDPSFGGGTGQVLTDLGGSNDRAEDVAVQPDGKIVAAGYSGSQFALVRYKADGTLDTSFGGTAAGKILGHFNQGSSDASYRVALQADGKIIVAGVTTPKNTSNVDLALLRYNSDGSLDTSFGTGGKVTKHFASPIGGGTSGGEGLDLALDPGASPLDPNAGKIVVVAQLQGGPVVAVRYNTNGSPDTGFGGGAGYVSVSTLNTNPAVAIQPDDRIVVTGYAGLDFGLARLGADGTPDASFGSGGLVVTPLPTVDRAHAVSLQPDGKIVVAGTQTSGTGGLHFMVARYSTNGSLDTSFGTTGIAVSAGVVADAKVDMALEPDGRIVVDGSVVVTSGPNAGAMIFEAARFLAAGPQIGSFTVNPDPVTAGSGVTLSASNITDANPGSSVTQVAFYQDANGDASLEPGTDTFLGYGAQTSPGVWTYTISTAGLTNGTYTLFAQAKDSYGVFGDPFAITVTIN
jgi:uncharacterized delta-60 repeat protein